jgi:DNA-directed RNA polymerase specialized sigma24 family protein
MAERKLYFGDAVEVLGARAKAHSGHIASVLSAYHNAHGSLVYRVSCECGRALRSPATELRLLVRPEVPGETPPSVMHAKMRYFLRELGASEYNPDTGEADAYAHLDKLTKRERQILILRFGIGRVSGLSLKEVGRYYGVTAERIRQIATRALKKLRDQK